MLGTPEFQFFVITLSIQRETGGNLAETLNGLSNVLRGRKKMADKIRAMVASGHVNLVETLAERIADIFLSDPRVDAVRVRVEKLDIFADAESVGVEIERAR